MEVIQHTPDYSNNEFCAINYKDSLKELEKKFYYELYKKQLLELNIKIHKSYIARITIFCIESILSGKISLARINYKIDVGCIIDYLHFMYGFCPYTITLKSNNKIFHDIENTPTVDYIQKIIKCTDVCKVRYNKNYTLTYDKLKRKLCFLKGFYCSRVRRFELGENELSDLSINEYHHWDNKYIHCSFDHAQNEIFANYSPNNIMLSLGALPWCNHEGKYCFDEDDNYVLYNENELIFSYDPHGKYEIVDIFEEFTNIKINCKFKLQLCEKLRNDIHFIKIQRNEKKSLEHYVTEGLYKHLFNQKSVNNRIVYTFTLDKQGNLNITEQKVNRREEYYSDSDDESEIDNKKVKRILKHIKSPSLSVSDCSDVCNCSSGQSKITLCDNLDDELQRALSYEKDIEVNDHSDDDSEYSSTVNYLVNRACMSCSEISIDYEKLCEMNNHLPIYDDNIELTKYNVVKTCKKIINNLYKTIEQIHKTNSFIITAVSQKLSGIEINICTKDLIMTYGFGGYSDIVTSISQLSGTSNYKSTDIISKTVNLDLQIDKNRNYTIVTALKQNITDNGELISWKGCYHNKKPCIVKLNLPKPARIIKNKEGLKFRSDSVKISKMYLMDTLYKCYNCTNCGIYYHDDYLYCRTCAYTLARKGLDVKLMDIESCPTVNTCEAPFKKFNYTEGQEIKIAGYKLNESNCDEVGIYFFFDPELIFDYVFDTYNKTKQSDKKDSGLEYSKGEKPFDVPDKLSEKPFDVENPGLVREKPFEVENPELVHKKPSDISSEKPNTIQKIYEEIELDNRKSSLTKQKLPKRPIVKKNKKDSCVMS
jgi:hypothetical protein